MACLGFASGVVGVPDQRGNRNAAAVRWAIAAGWASLALVGLAVRPASAAVPIQSNNPAAHDCYIAAKFGDKQKQGISACTAAIRAESAENIGQVPSKHNLAGLLVNRGVIHLSYAQYGPAISDLTASIKLDPTIGEAYVNLGASLIGKKKFAEGRAQIDEGLRLNAEEPAKAYYNRGLADDYLDDEKAAYFDYLKASQLDPDWDLPKHELTRFTVTPAPPK
jgi:tetratricopeptide (TPR) repeat protein